MVVKFATILVLLLIATVANVAALLLHVHQAQETNKPENSSCPAWTWNDNHTCTCFDTVKDIVKCTYKPGSTDVEVQLLACYCMTHSDILNQITIGNCLYSCDHKYYQTITSPISKLNNQTCSRLNRKGQLCGKCEDNYSPPVYSYTSCCIECNDGHKIQNWFKYIAIAFIPLTVFYSSVIAFRLSATSAKLNGYIMVSQLVSTPAQLRYIYSLHDNKDISTCTKKHPNHEDILRRTLVAVYSFWNLDFFRSFYPPFCTQANLSPLMVISLDYIVAVYPLCLVVLTYIWVELKDRFQFFNRLIRPLQNCSARFRSEWNIRTSLIDAFATFILLSYVKILNVSVDLLTPTGLHSTSGVFLKRRFLYYDGTVEMFKGSHIRYAVLAIFMMTVFNLIPLVVLFLYPCRCVHKVLNALHLHSQALHTFMDSFQGCYKIKPYDCRYFASIYLGLRIACLVLFACTLDRFYYPVVALLFMCMTVVVSIVRPYKSKAANYTDTGLLLAVSFCYMSLSGYALTPGKIYNKTFLWLCCSMVPIPPLYAFGLLLYKLVPRRCAEKIRGCIQRMMLYFRGHSTLDPENMPLLYNYSVVNNI